MNSVLEGFIVGAIIGGTVAGLVFGIKKLIWKDKVPQTIQKLRWFIAIIIGIFVAYIEIICGITEKNKNVANLIVVAVVVIIAEALKGQSKQKSSEEKKKINE